MMRHGKGKKKKAGLSKLVATLGLRGLRGRKRVNKFWLSETCRVENGRGGMTNWGIPQSCSDWTARK